MRLLLVAGLLLAGCAGAPAPTAAPLPNAVATWQPAAPRSPLVLDQQDADPTVCSPHAPGTRIAVASVAVPRDHEPALELPEGARVPMLNGVATGMRLPAGGAAPAAIVAVEVDSKGREWYVHEDGCRSTTYYVWRRDLGRYDAIARHSMPDRGVWILP